MAIYNNREVTVVAPTSRPNPPQTIVVQYTDGSHETVGIGKLYFTEEEKKNLIKNHPSDFDNVNVISDNDLKAVRVGVAPSSDPSYREQAEAQAKTEEAQKLQQQQVEEAKRSVQKDQSKPAPQPVTQKTK